MRFYALIPVCMAPGIPIAIQTTRNRWSLPTANRETPMKSQTNTQRELAGFAFANAVAVAFLVILTRILVL